MNVPQTQPLTLFLAATTVRATVLLLAATGAGALLRRTASASTRHLVWLLALAGLFALPVLSPLLPRWRLAVMAPAPDVAPLESSAVAAPQPAAALLDAPVAARPLDDAIDGPRRGEAPALPPGTWLVGVYLAGVGALLVRLARQQRRLARIGATASAVTAPEWMEALSTGRAELGIRRPVRLVRAGSAAMPMTWGALRPVVAVPEEAEAWTAGRRSAVLLHELAHVARFDSLAQAAAAVACALYWFHPGVWLLARQLRRESELACDDRVLLAGARPHAYAGELLAVARSFSAAPAPALAVGMASPSQLESRLRALLDAGRARRAPGWPTRAAAAGVTVLVLGSLASAQLARRPALHARVQSTSAADTRGHRYAEADRAPAPTSRRDAAQPGVLPAADVVPALLAALPAGAQEGLTGRWELGRQSFGDMRPGFAQLQMRLAPNSYSGTTVALSRFAGLGGAIPAGTAPARFELRGEAGTIVFEGEFRGGEGAGTFRFTPARDFAAGLQRRGLGTATSEELARAVIFDVTLARVDALLAVLSQKPAIDELTRLIGHAVSPDYIRQLASVGYRDASAEDIIRLSNHDITIPWIRDVQGSGYREASVEDLIRLSNHDIDVAWIRELQSLGYRGASVEDMIRMKNHSVDTDWIRGFQAIGYRELTPEDLIRMKSNGVDVGYVRTLQTLGYERVGAEDLIRMHRRGVTPDFIRGENARHGERLSPEDLIRARDRGN